MSPEELGIVLPGGCLLCCLGLTTSSLWPYSFRRTMSMASQSSGIEPLRQKTCSTWPTSTQQPELGTRAILLGCLGTGRGHEMLYLLADHALWQVGTTLDQCKWLCRGLVGEGIGRIPVDGGMVGPCRGMGVVHTVAQEFMVGVEDPEEACCNPALQRGVTTGLSSVLTPEASHKISSNIQAQVS